MESDVVLITACDQRYYPLCADLLVSLKSVFGVMPRIRVLDLGLAPDQLSALAGRVEKVIAPDWDVGGDMNLPPWYRAMTARPFLPKYAGDAAVIAWLDSDVWLQRREPVAALIQAARDGALAIVEERFGKGFSISVRDGQGRVDTRSYTTANAKANTRACYEKCFGLEVAAAFGDLPSFNSGVFALRADSPSWAVWQQIFAPALARQSNFLAEQQALNVAIRRGLIPVSKQPVEANYACHLELPWYSEQHGAFTFPSDENRILGSIHLCDTKIYGQLPIPHFPNGALKLTPLAYGAVQTMRAGPH